MGQSDWESYIWCDCTGDIFQLCGVVIMRLVKQEIIAGSRLLDVGWLVGSDKLEDFAK